MKAKRQPVHSTEHGLILPTQRDDRPMLIDGWGLAKGLAEHNWTAHNVAPGHWYPVTCINYVSVYAHQFLGFTGGDHIDRDGMNVRRSNLRPATRSQQTANQAKRRSCRGVTPSSRFKGVGRNGERWMVLVGPAGPGRYRGAYATEEEAALVANYWLDRCFGEFAQLNVVEV
jgi:hypothetical protein